MMDEHALGFGQHRILGTPYHGLVRGNRLTLPNGTHIDDRWFADSARGSYRVQVPAVPAISRTPAEVAADSAAGYQWRTDAVISLWGNNRELYLYGRKSFNGQAFYALGPGDCWAVRLPFDMSPNGDKTELLSAATVSAFGRQSFAPVDDTRPITVTLTGYSLADFYSFPADASVTWDSLPDGSQVIVGGAQFDALPELYRPAPGTFDLLKTSGLGTVESPFAVELQQLSTARPGLATYTDELVTFEGRWTLDYTTVDEFRPVEGQSCEWLFRTHDNPNVILLPPGIVSAETPAITIITGTRSARIDGYVIGYWFSPGGTPTPITLDMAYTLEATFDFNIGAVGAPAPEASFAYTDFGSGCVLDGTGGGEEYPGVFNWNCAVEKTNTETVEIVLRVGGAEVDRVTIKGEYVFTQTFNDSLPAVLVLPGEGAAVESTRNLRVNDELLDTTGYAYVGSGVGIADSAPERILDPLNKAASSDVYDWLPTLVNSAFQLDIDPTISVATQQHWWSNHLVCLRRTLQPIPGPAGRSYIYGLTAHPGGVTASEISVPAPSPAENATARYGALDPFTGDVLLGETEKVTYV